MYQFKLEAARKLAAETGLGEMQAYRCIELRAIMERRSGEDRRAMIRANIERRAAGE